MTPAARNQRHRVPENPQDNRTPAQRDRDRVLYSSAFRRLGGVTQVVLAGEGHLFHNRLTHSLKVAQIGRRIAEMLLRSSRGSPSEVLTLRQLGGLDPDVVETAGLAHDLGHPPFGHIAEQELDKLVRESGVSDGFEGNAQTFRIVTKLALVLDDTEGLNLTRATLNAILKYPWLHQGGARKWGAFATELDDFQWTRKGSGLADRRRSLEAEIMDWADDIAYAVHDVEDFYRAGFIPLERLQGHSTSKLNPLFDRVAIRWKEVLGHPRLTHTQLQKAARSTLRNFPLTEPYAGTRSDRVKLRLFTAGLIGRYVRATSFSAGGLRIQPQAIVEVALLKELTRQYVVESPALATQQHGQRRIVGELFTMFRDALIAGDAAIIPARFRQQAEALSGRPNADTDRTRLAADCVASMTEEQAITVHQRLTGSQLGSLVEWAIV
jgi:dGTPase